jgi:hypothetical protein
VLLAGFEDDFLDEAAGDGERVGSEKAAFPAPSSLLEAPGLFAVAFGGRMGKLRSLSSDSC